MSESRFRSTEWAGTEARDTTPSPRGECSLNGGGGERAPVTVGCDKRKVSVAGSGLRRKGPRNPNEETSVVVTKSPTRPQEGRMGHPPFTGHTVGAAKGRDTNRFPPFDVYRGRGWERQRNQQAGKTKVTNRG